MNDNLPHITVLLLLVIIASALLYFLLSFRNTRQKRTPPPNPGRSAKGKPCPLCGEFLFPGEKVHSVVYPGKPDRLMEIFGCPHCERPSSPNSRICPVCKKKMPDGAVLIARVFEKPEKTHVHVLGCTDCYKGRSKIKKN